MNYSQNNRGTKISALLAKQIAEVVAKNTNLTKVVLGLE
jgi:hypothetical protein